MRCRLTLLGPVSLTSASGAPNRRAVQQRRVALLAVLATSGESVSRDRLVGLLWPDRDERAARHLLADSLYVLRQTAVQANIDRLSGLSVGKGAIRFVRPEQVDPATVRELLRATVTDSGPIC